MVDLFRYRHWDLVSKRGLYYLISLIMLVIGLVAMVLNYQKHGEIVRLGLDFTGGGGVMYNINGRLSSSQHAEVIKQIRDDLEQKGVESEVKVSPAAVGSESDQIIVNTQLVKEEGANQEDVFAAQITDTITPVVTSVIAEHLPNADAPELTSTESVSATVSMELLQKSILALVIGSILIMLWIGVRYNIGGLGARYALSSIIALLHDLLTLIGMFALFYGVLEVNSPFIAALLTVLGYSIHDTIVIFDRLRENIRHRKGRTFAETVNISLLETMARSVNTVLTVLFTLLALFFFGGSTLRDFVAAMLIGVTIGAYSSIFVASQLLVSWSKDDQKVILPWEAPVPVAASDIAVTASTTPEPVAAAVSTAASTSREAIRRARQAGKAKQRR